MQDMENPNQYIVALALTSFCEISDADMCESIFPAILTKIRSPQKYIKKKALLACMRVLKKLPQKAADLEDYCPTLLDDKNHGLMICGIELALEIVRIKPAFKVHFHAAARRLTRLLKELTVQYSSEYDVDGVNDPFLQTGIVRLLLELCDDEMIKEDFCALLAQVTVNLPGREAANANYSNTPNSCNAILFECVRAIMLIEAPPTLKKIGVTVLSNFLQFKDINSKYISLRSLAVAAQSHKQAVQKHLESIISCLDDTDLSIRRMILEILKLIADENNISQITRTLFNDMLSCSPEVLKDMTPSVCQIIELNAPSKVWYFDSMLRILVIAGNYVDEESVYGLIGIISNTAELQAYALYKLYFAALDNQNQEGLLKCLFYLVGEHASILFSGIDPFSKQNLPRIPEDKIVGLLLDLSKTSVSFGVRQVGLNAMVKIEGRLTQQAHKNSIKQFIQASIKSEDYECQTRAFEYNHLLQTQWSDWKEEIFKTMPAPDPAFFSVSEKSLGAINLDDVKSASVAGTNGDSNLVNTTAPEVPKATPSGGGLLDLDLLGSYSTPADTPSNPKAELNLFDLDSTPVHTNPAKKSDPLDLLGGGWGSENTGMSLLGPGPTQPTINTTPQLNDMDLMNSVSTPTTAYSNNANLDLLDGMSGASPTMMTPHSSTYGNMHTPTSTPKSALDDLDLIGSNLLTGGSSSTPKSRLEFVAQEEGPVALKIIATKTGGSSMKIEMICRNKSHQSITNLKLAISAAKYVTVDLGQATGTTLFPNGQNEIRQTISAVNSQQGSKQVMLKVKVKFDIDNQPQETMVTINQIPVDF